MILHLPLITTICCCYIIIIKDGINSIYAYIFFLLQAKLCLIVMSLPAYEICTVAYQTAIQVMRHTETCSRH